MLDHNRNLRIGSSTPSATPGVVVLDTLTDLPTDGYVGQLIYIKDSDEFRIYDADAWRTLSGGSGSSGNQIFVSTTEPTNPNIGDGWLNPTTKVISVWSGTGWVSPSDLALSKTTTFYTAPGDPEPVAQHDGDIWFIMDSADSQVKVWGSAGGWQPVTWGSTAISAQFVTALAIRADQITTGSLSVNQHLIATSTKGTVDISGDGIYGAPTSTGRNRFELPTDPAKRTYFEGDGVFGNLTVNGSFSVNASPSVSSGNQITLAGSGSTAQQPPNLAPQVAVDYLTRAYTIHTGKSWTKVRGFGYYSGYLYALHADSSTQTSLLVWDSSTGAAVSSQVFKTASTGQSVYNGGCVVLSGTLYGINVVNGPNQTWIESHQFSLSSPSAPAYLGKSAGNSTTVGYFVWSAPWTVATEGSYIYVLAKGAATSKPLLLQLDAPSSLGAFSTSDGGLSWNISGVTAGFICRSVGQGGDFSSYRWGTADGAGGWMRVFDIYGTQVTGDEWETNTSAQMHGLWWDGSNFWILDETGTARRYEGDSSMRGWDPSGNSDDWYVAYAWRSSSYGYTTTRSPEAYLNMSRRARLKVTIQPYPSGGTYPVNQAQVYLKVGSAPSSVTTSDMYTQSPSLTSPTTTLSYTSVVKSNVYGMNYTSNGFGTSTGASASIANQNGTLRVDGGGTISCSALNVSGNTTLSGNLQAPTITGVSTINGQPVGSGSSVPVGTIVMYAGTSAPSGWLMCNGGNFSSSTYPNLYSVLGSPTLPNLSGRFPMGSSGVHALRSSGGSETHTLTVAEMPAHDHALHSNTSVGSSLSRVRAGDSSEQSGSPSAAAVNQTGGGAAFSILNPYYVVNFIIKT